MPNRLLPSIGTPVGSIIQYAYTVDDIDLSLGHYVDDLGVGPWYRLGPFTPQRARYRGQPTSPTLTLARAFNGSSMIELIQQHDDGPSIYRERFEVRGHGFHHWAVTTDVMDAEIARFAARGMGVVFEDVLATGERIVYVDTSAELPGYLELIELSDAQEAKFAAFHRSSVGWDGRDPYRIG